MDRTYDKSDMRWAVGLTLFGCGWMVLMGTAWGHEFGYKQGVTAGQSGESVWRLVEKDDGTTKRKLFRNQHVEGSK